MELSAVNANSHSAIQEISRFFGTQRFTPRRKGKLKLVKNSREELLCFTARFEVRTVRLYTTS
jgi:hypothetical protein